ncbi:hypothetical protein F442_19876 [Phytophthora nicotianae P10297]|uniref:Uncharacterized protein n=1 Tax=Phytophthora nicotianae P10297 TaxID=1317064 RepID=W2Y840_PHYNI|nr:hypothetical protein F442_19876 [Phytophthora nicotianae P10297]
MLPQQVATGVALAAATARALAASAGPHDLPSDDSDDEDDQVDRAAAPAPTEDLPADGYPPGRASGMLPAGGVAITGAPRSSATATTSDHRRRAPADDDNASPSRTTAATPTKDPANVPPIPGRAGSMLAATLATTAQVFAAAATAPAHRVVVVAAAPASPPAGRAVVEHHARAEPPQDQEFQAPARVETQVSDASNSRLGCNSMTQSGDGNDSRHQDHDGQAVAAVPMDVDQGAWWPTADQQPLSPPPELRVGGKRRRLNDGGDADARELAELLLLDEEEVGTHAPAPRLSAASAHPTSVLAVYAHNAQSFNCTLCVYSAASFAALTRHRDSRHRRTAFLDRFSAGCACTEDRQAASRWGPPLPRSVVTSRIATRLETAPTLRWGPPLPRELVAGRIAGRLTPTAADEEETKDSERPATARNEAAKDADDSSGEWLLRFDGACRANPGPGGAGAALFKPSGSVV